MQGDSLTSPDTHGSGLVDAPLDALRYDACPDDPYEAGGLLRALMPENVRVLDVGCGTGSVTVFANDGKNNRVTAVEPDPDRAALARSRGLDAVCGYVDQDFLDTHGPFDVIVFADVLEHLPSPDAMLALARRGLKPGGLVLASVPNVAHWSIRTKLLFGQFEYQEFGLCDATHLRWFTQQSIVSLFRSAGFDIVSLDHSAGTMLSVYGNRYLRMIPKGVLHSTLHALVRHRPTLFGCQFIIKARKPD
jgi:2-polyprenyl-3-methyl-5-hydroxy-6-metoxy-1,4-benzoquinol methylase